ncbi:MAG: hypothetical protein HC844_13410, partial [Tabrizicola sp.]|nr:hypothetical protein [Tabrizicola sp.]
MTDTPLSSALREIRAHLASPVVLAALAGTTLILLLSGPFRTLDLLAPVPRAAYWAAVVFGTYAIGTAVLTLLYLWPRFGELHPVLRVAMASPVMGLAVAAALVALNFGLGNEAPTDLAALTAQVGLAAVISVKVPDPQFESQTKIKLGNREAQSIVETWWARACAPGSRRPPSTARAIFQKSMDALRARRG